MEQHEYAHEEFTDEERHLLSRYFTNCDGPVFALTNLPEVVKGALFARYSRSSKSLRRLFLDEFANESDEDAFVHEGVTGPAVGTSKASALYQRVFTEY